MPSLHQLRTFVEVCECGSVHAAAERLMVSQPAVSAALTALARKVGVSLFERDGRGLRLSDAGKLMESYARRILALIDEGFEEVRATGQSSLGYLRLAAVTTPAEHILPKLLEEFRAREGPVRVELEVANRARLWSLLTNWEVELVLAGRPPQGGTFRSLATRPNELVIVARPGTGPWTMEVLAQQTWLLRERGSGTRITTEEFLGQLGIAPPLLTIGSNGAIREGVRCGLGISLLSRDAIGTELEMGSLQIVPNVAAPLERPWHVVCNAERDLTPAATRFVRYLCMEAGFAASPWGAGYCSSLA